MKIGDKVTVTAKDGREVEATVEKINRKSVRLGFVEVYHKGGTIYRAIYLRAS